MSDQTIGTWPNDHAPVQNLPLTSSDERMHVLNETCWCEPNILAEGQGDNFRILEIDHQPQGGPSTSIRWTRDTFGTTTERNAAGATILVERPHATEDESCWCGPTVETFGG